MKSLLECAKNEELRVVKLYAEPELKHRLISFGILKGTHIKIIEITTNKNMIKIQAGKTMIALRGQEAKAIEVETI